jgi:serine/threonine protein kinase
VPAQHDDPMIGRLIGNRYEVQRLIGKGGMAYVYMGTDTQQSREVAIKIITLQRDRANELMKRFQREERVIRQIEEHPNIIQIYDSGAEDQDTHYLLMELIRGETLTQRLKRYRRKGEFMPYDEVYNILSQTADAIDHVHRHNAIHRDIKPSNIMIEKGTDRAVLMDFGLVMDFANNTTLGTAFGTPRYISPEQAISSQQAVPQSDVYSLGVVLYETLVGSTPFDEDSAMSMALSHITNAPPPPRFFRDDIPDEIAEVVLKALEKQPQDRYQTSRELMDALRVAIAAVQDPTYQAEPLPVEDTSLRVLPATVPHDYPDDAGQAPRGLYDTPSQPAIPAPMPHPDSETVMQPNQDEPEQQRRTLPLVVGLIVAAVLLLAVGFLMLGGNGDGNGDANAGGEARSEDATSEVNEDNGTNATGTIDFPTAVGFDPNDDIHLYYSNADATGSGDEAFFIYNNTNRTIDLVEYRFALPDQSSSLNPFFFGDQTRRIAPNTCIRISLERRSISNSPAVCNTENLTDIYHRRKIQQDYFWVWDTTANPNTNSFLVVTDDGQQVQECLISEEACSFNATSSQP